MVNAQEAATVDPVVVDPVVVDPVVDLYVGKCASCHTVGKGDRVGPDLKDSHQRRDPAWLRRFIQAPSTLLDTDPTARELLQAFNGVRMPDLGLTTEQVDALVALISRCSSKPCDLVGKFTPVTEATPDHVSLGRGLFTGEVALAAGGLPCISCHTSGTMGSVAGGSLAKDLSYVFARLGDEGLDAALTNPSFKLMNKIYGERPLDKAESFALRAFLYEANRTEAEGSEAWSALLVGLLGSGLILAVLNAFWSRRLLSVRLGVRPRRRGPLGGSRGNARSVQEREPA